MKTGRGAMSDATMVLSRSTMKDALASQEAMVEASLAELDRTVERMKAASARSLASSEVIARTARASRSSQSNPQMAAVRLPSQPPVSSTGRTSTADELASIDPADLTSRFKVLKRGL